MLISVFTPTHDISYIYHAYKSILAQTYTDWEWIVLLNGDCQDPNIYDPRVKRSCWQ